MSKQPEGGWWEVAERTWSKGKWRFFLFNAKHIHLRDGKKGTYGPIWFKTRGSAQREANRMNGEAS